MVLVSPSLSGSPEEAKDLGLGGPMQMPDVSGVGHQMAPEGGGGGGGGGGHLAKPVPMRRLSEKRIAQARAACVSGAGAMGHAPDSAIGE